MEKKLTSSQTHNIISSIQNYYFEADNPPAKTVKVYNESIKSVKDEDGFYQATVKILVDYVGQRSHKVNLKFKTNRLGRVLTETISYI